MIFVSKCFVQILSILLSVLFLTSCATTQKYETVLDSWVGSSEEKLVSLWGPPDSVYVISNTKKMLTYSSASNVILPGSAPHYTTNYIGNTAYTTSYGGSSPISVDLSCKTSFTVDKGQITQWRWEGNNCVSS